MGICLVKSKWKPQSFAVLDIFCNDFFLFSNSCRKKYLTNWRTTNKKLIRQHGIYYIVGTCDPDGCLAFVTAWCLLGLKTLPYRSPVLQANFYTCKWCVQHSSLHSAYESWTEESQDLALAGGANIQFPVSSWVSNSCFCIWFTSFFRVYIFLNYRRHSLSAN